MEFVEVAYAYLMPFLLIFLLFLRGYPSFLLKNGITVVNVSLMLFVVYDIRSYYEMYQFAKAFGIEINLKVILQTASSNYFILAKNLLVIILPFFFLVKKLGSNLVLTSMMLLFFWYDVFAALFTHQQINLPGYNYTLYHLQALKMLSLYTSIYALWWLLKRFKKYSIIE